MRAHYAEPEHKYPVRSHLKIMRSAAPSILLLLILFIYFSLCIFAFVICLHSHLFDFFMFCDFFC